MKLTLEELKAHCIPNPEVRLPQRDEFGIPHTPKYKPDVADFSSLGSFTRFHKPLGASTATVSRSRLETVMDYKLMFCRFAVEVRPLYPIPGGHIDRVVTVIRLDSGLVHLHGLNLGSRRGGDGKARDRWRNEERQFLESRGYSWEFRTLSQEEEFTGTNFRRLQTWCRRSDDAGGNNWHLCYAEEALEFAARLLRSTAKGVMDRAMSICANRQNCDLDYAYKLFAVAVGRGYLELDNRYELSPLKALHLLR